MTTHSICRRIATEIACYRFRLGPCTLSYINGDQRRLSTSTMSGRAIEYMHVEGAEDPNEYRRGGYHPILIGDRLHHQKYRVVHKLGHGSFSTVWLAIEDQSSRYVAIKVGTADTDRTEGDILSRLTQVVPPESRERGLFPVVLDRFDIAGPNGTHPCTVTLPAQGSLRAIKRGPENLLLQHDTAQSLAVQLALSVACIHSHGYAQGDIHPGNMLLQLPASFSALTLAGLYARFGKPRQITVLTTDKEPPRQPGVPPYLVPPVWLDTRSLSIQPQEAKLVLSDFGVAFRPRDKTRFESYTPLAYRPPEAHFIPTTPLTLASDIWSFGCVIFELFAIRPLIDTAWGEEQDEVTAQQVELQGKTSMPSEWWDNWEERPRWYDESGHPLSDPDAVWPWQRRFEEWVQQPRKNAEKRLNATIGFLDAEEYEALLDLLKRMLAWKPDERPDAREALESPWMQEWALPAYQRSLSSTV